ncbi:MAG: hypothetical protein NWR39_02340, partial [Pseudomonadota bacterium]|nr:hypothetical protein [Pseudomonadota bacterium]
MNKNFIYGLCAAFILISAYKSGQALLNKKDDVVQEEIPLSLIDINFSREANSKSMPDIAIEKHEKES